MKRSQIRELAFKLIYSCEVQKEMDDEQTQIFIEENQITEKDDVTYITEVYRGIKKNKDEISSLISKNLKEKWTMERIAKIDFAILEVAIFELIYTKLPYKVVIDEAVKLSKKYGNEKSKLFVNGILASIVKEKNLA